MAALTQSEIDRLERAMNQAGLLKESKRQEFIKWFVRTYSQSERGLKSSSDLKKEVQDWMDIYGSR